MTIRTFKFSYVLPGADKPIELKEEVANFAELQLYIAYRLKALGLQVLKENAFANHAIYLDDYIKKGKFSFTETTPVITGKTVNSTSGKKMEEMQRKMQDEV